MSNLHHASVASPARVAGLADQCVRCGLCLPHCPSYRVRSEEGDSPRGRIAFARALALGKIAADDAISLHLDRCLACGVCEDVCPSRVAWLPQLVATRARGARSRAAKLVARISRALARRRLFWRALAATRRYAPSAGALARWPRLAAAVGLWHGIDAPARSPAVPATPRSGRRQRIVLFRGCVASVVDADVHDAAARVLAHLGHHVELPRTAHCCGALARHAGAIDESARDVARAARVVAACGGAALVSASTGCAAAIRDDVAPRAGMAASDVIAFVESDAAFAALALRPLARRAALMPTCTQREAGGLGPVRAVLSRIPGLVLEILPQQPRCCGAAGTYALEQPRDAAALRDERLDQIVASAPDLVLTSNVGCRIHLAAGLRARGSGIRVAHPVTLLAEALP